MDVLNKVVAVCLFCSLLQEIKSLDNGLAVTPPMGWMSWERFRCVTDCEKDPRNCISERLYMEIADAMVYGGYREAGYQYVCIDDCWAAMNRTKEGHLQADTKRFPSGIKKLADYVHSRGLKLGIYADYGTKTCAGYPGSIKNIKTDAQTFADWGIDYLKLDGCYANPRKMDKGYPKFARALNKTGRPIVFSCSWPAYQVYMNMTPNYEKIGKHCNLWRNYQDIQDSFNSVVDIYSWYGDNQDDLIPAAGKGHWNDPDMLIIGNFGLSYEQSKLQFALWAIMASPLLMSNDLRNIDPRSREILLNTEIIAVNQDRLGKQGKRAVKDNASFTEIWFRPLSYCGSVAVVLLSLRSDLPVDVKVSFSDVGISTKRACARDLFAHQELGVYEKLFTAKVNPSGVVMIRLIPICDEEKTPEKTDKKKTGKGSAEKTDKKKTGKGSAEKTDKKKAGKGSVEKTEKKKAGKGSAEKTDKKEAGKGSSEKTDKKAGKGSSEKTDKKKAGKGSTEKTDKKAGKGSAEKTDKKAGKGSTEKTDKKKAGKGSTEKTDKKAGKGSTEKTDKKEAEKTSKESTEKTDKKKAVKGGKESTEKTEKKKNEKTSKESNEKTNKKEAGKAGKESTKKTEKKNNNEKTSKESGEKTDKEAEKTDNETEKTDKEAEKTDNETVQKTDEKDDRKRCNCVRLNPI